MGNIIEKKKKISKAISTEKKTWLAQPVGFTLAKHNYSVVQTRAMVKIFQYMQKSILSVISLNEGESDLNVQLALYNDVPPTFMKEEDIKSNCIYLRIPYNQFGVKPNYYETMLESLKAMSSIIIEIKRKSKSNQEYTAYPHLFTVMVPPKGDNEVWFEIEKRVALEMIDVKTMGYTKYIMETVFSSSSRYTQRIYIYICSWIDVGYTPWIKLEEFRDMLKIEKTEYKRFCDFYRKVIKPAYDDLREKAINDETNCFFELEKKWYPGRTKKGNPDEIRFQVFQSNYGKKSEEQGVFMTQKIDIYAILRDEFRMGNNAVRICNQLTEDLLDEFNRELERIRTFVRTNKSITNKAAYATTCLKEFFIRKKKDKEEKLQPLLPFEADNGNSTNNIKGRSCTDEASLALWNEVVNEFKLIFSELDFHTWIQSIEIIEFKKEDEKSVITLKAPSKFVVEYVEEHFIAAMSEPIKKIFGQHTELLWLV